MLGNKYAYKKQIVNAMFIIMGIAMVLSFASTVFATNSNDEVASFKTMGTAIIKGSENVPEIVPIEFLKNVWRNTGLNQIINGEIPPAEHVHAEDPHPGVLPPPPWHRYSLGRSWRFCLHNRSYKRSTWKCKRSWHRDIAP